MYSAIEQELREHDPHDLNRFDPVMVIIEYMRIDNLRLIDMFGYLDIDGRGLVSRDNLRQGVAVSIGFEGFFLEILDTNSVKKRHTNYLKNPHFIYFMLLILRINVLEKIIESEYRIHIYSTYILPNFTNDSVNDLTFYINIKSMTVKLMK